MSAEVFALELQSALTRTEVADAYLATVKAVIDADAVGLYQLDGTSQRVLDVRVRAAGDFLDAYERYGRADDPVLQHVLVTGTAIDSSRLPGARWVRSGAKQALGVAGFGHSLEAPIVTSGCLFGTINFARAADDRPFSAVDVAGAESVAKHLGRAIERAVRYELSAQRSRAFEQTIERITQPVVITDWEGRVVLQNRAAIEACCVEASDRRAELADCLSGAIDAATHSFADDGRRVHTRTVQTRTSKRLVAKTYRLADATRASATFLYDCGGPASAGVLPKWDVLTTKEQQIAELVSEGLTTREIGERAFISENTVKQHLKRIYVKVGVSNRAELVQLAWVSSAGRRSAVTAVN